MFCLKNYFFLLLFFMDDHFTYSFMIDDYHPYQKALEGPRSWNLFQPPPSTLLPFNSISLFFSSISLAISPELSDLHPRCPSFQSAAKTAVFPTLPLQTSSIASQISPSLSTYGTISLSLPQSPTPSLGEAPSTLASTGLRHPTLMSSEPPFPASAVKTFSSSFRMTGCFRSAPRAAASLADSRFRRLGKSRS